MSKMEIKANDPNLKTWVKVAKDSDFPIQNLPFGIFSDDQNATQRVGVAIGDFILDLSVLDKNGLFDKHELPDDLFEKSFLNDFMALGKAKTRAIRNHISDLLEEGNATLRDNESLRATALIEMAKAEMHLPVKVGDYTDFYSSEEHATNVGTMFRDPDNALLPNWKHIPVGYHGRASSIIPTGQKIHRPKGQTKPKEEEPPVFGPCKLLDFELEMAFITCGKTNLGDSIKLEDTEDYIFGFVLFNDWSARDIQKWEYVPLGPFLAKSFASSISPWVVTMDALAPFKTAGPEQKPEVLPYLKQEGKNNFDIDLEVGIIPPKSTETVVCRSNFKHMYWSVKQQLAHQTVNGCNINTGDMYASGTISGKDASAYGSMLELSWKGTKPLKMPDGTERKFLQDGDTVVMRGHAERDGIRVGFGEVRTEILPAKD